MPSALSPAQSTPSGEHRLRVLVAEDHELNQLLIEEAMETLGFDAVIAADGESALAALETGAFDAVLMDCHMPGLDGFEATARIRAMEADGRRSGRIPIIALTAGAFDEDRERCLAAGMDDFLSKPFDLDTLGGLVRKWCG